MIKRNCYLGRLDSDCMHGGWMEKGNVVHLA